MDAFSDSNTITLKMLIITLIPIKCTLKQLISQFYRFT